MNGRSKLGSAMVAAALALCAAQVALAQVEWEVQGAVVPPGPPGSWNAGNQETGDVVFDGTTYHLFILGGTEPGLATFDQPS